MITKKSATKTAPAPAPESRDWKIFFGDGRAPSHEWQERMPEPPPWRLGRRAQPLRFPRNVAKNFAEAELRRAEPFLPSQPMVLAVNTALYLRRPLLLTGTPGTGKSTLISKVAHELQLGPALRWPITSRSNVKAGVYAYDAVGRLQSGRKNSPITEYLTLGPLGTALSATTWPRALLIDEIDKSDLDFANDLLNIIEDGTYDIPELARLPPKNTAGQECRGCHGRHSQRAIGMRSVPVRRDDIERRARVSTSVPAKVCSAQYRPTQRAAAQGDRRQSLKRVFQDAATARTNRHTGQKISGIAGR